MRNKNSLKNEIPWSNVRMQAGLVPPHTVAGKQFSVSPQQPCPLLKSHLGYVIPQSDKDIKYAIFPAIIYASESYSISISKTAKNKLQQIQISFLTFITKAYERVSY
jgi:hypothetical protein